LSLHNETLRSKIKRFRILRVPGRIGYEASLGEPFDLKHGYISHLLLPPLSTASAILFRSFALWILWLCGFATRFRLEPSRGLIPLRAGFGLITLLSRHGSKPESQLIRDQRRDVWIFRSNFGHLNSNPNKQMNFLFNVRSEFRLIFVSPFSRNGMPIYAVERMFVMWTIASKT